MLHCLRLALASPEMALHKIVLSSFQVLVCLGKEHISQDGMVRLTHPHGFSALAPQFVNNGYVTAESTFSTEHECHKVLAGLQTAVCDVCVWTPPGKVLKCAQVCYVSCYGYSVSQERIKVSPVPMAL